MKKLVGTVSVALILGCSLALANADDMSNNGQNSGNSMNSSDTSNPSNTSKGVSSTDSTTTTTTTTASNKKSCIDANGKTLNKGQTGYKACVKAHKKEQMGGTVGDDSSDIHQNVGDSPSDMNPADTTRSGNDTRSNNNQ